MNYVRGQVWRTTNNYLNKLWLSLASSVIKQDQSGWMVVSPKPKFVRSEGFLSSCEGKTVVCIYAQVTEIISHKT